MPMSCLRLCFILLYGLGELFQPVSLGDIIIVGNTADKTPYTVNAEGKTFLLDQEIPSPGVVVAFTAYFTNLNPVTVQIWRPIDVLNNEFMLTGEVEIKPYDSEIQQKTFITQMTPPVCIEVKPGDRLGVYIPVSPSSVTYLYDLNVNVLVHSVSDPSQAPSVGEVVSFDTLAFPFKFSLNAVIDIGTVINETYNIPHNCSDIFELYETTTPFETTTLPIIETTHYLETTAQDIQVTYATEKRGEKGDPGIPGIPGTNGVNGTKGDKGDRGEPGPPGSGDKGEPGIKGPQGLKGDKGSIGGKGGTGEKGVQGKKGARGEKGDIGPQGPNGQRGLKGDMGPRGNIGLTGPNGSKGTKGDAGAPKGEKGDMGLRGPTGQKGEVGLQGPPGLPANNTNERLPQAGQSASGKEKTSVMVTDTVVTILIIWHILTTIAVIVLCVAFCRRGKARPTRRVSNALVITQNPGDHTSTIAPWYGGNTSASHGVSYNGGGLAGKSGNRYKSTGNSTTFHIANAELPTKNGLTVSEA